MSSKLIETKGVKKNNILNGIDFSMNEGEMVAIMGPSGSGKSTFLYQLSGMDRPDEGGINFAGQDITANSEEENAKIRLESMGFVFQQINMLDSLNVVDNIMLPAVSGSANKRKSKKSMDAIKEKALGLMKKTGLEGLERRMIHEVSGGQLQRAGICRALMNDPKILFADEPTGALNQAASKEVMDELSKLNNEGMSILIVTHDSKVAARCNRVLYMVDGYIVSECKPGEGCDNSETARNHAIGVWLGQMGW